MTKGVRHAREKMKESEIDSPLFCPFSTSSDCEMEKNGSLVASFKRCCCPVAKSCPTLRPHGLQYTGPLSPSLSPGVCPSSWPLNLSCYPTVSSSAALFSFCLQLLKHKKGLVVHVNYILSPGGKSSTLQMGNRQEKSAVHAKSLLLCLTVQSFGL